MPTALTQPLQSGWQATQLNCIGSLRSSRVPPACAELPSVVTAPGKARQRAAAPRAPSREDLSDLTSLNLVPSPKAPTAEQWQWPHSTPHDSVIAAS